MIQAGVRVNPDDETHPRSTSTKEAVVPRVRAS